MALAKAVLIGAVAAVAMPWAMWNERGKLGYWVHRGAIDLSLGSAAIHWSWPIFCAVTLFAWGFLDWANR